MTPLICPRCRALHGPQLERCIFDGLDLEPALADPWLGAVLAQRYYIEGVLADGARSRVYAVRDLASDRRLALKLLLAEHATAPESATRFLREIEIGRHLEHPSLLELVDTGVVAGLPYLVSRRVTGPSLDARIASGGALGADQAALLFGQLCGAMATMHGAGIVHRDLDASHVLLDGPQRAVIHGFAGGSRRCRRGRAHTEPMRRLHAPTSEPRSPEDRDLHSLGLILAAMLVGRAKAPNADSSARDDQPLGVVYRRLTSSDPAQRYRSIADVLADVGRPRSAPIR